MNAPTIDVRTTLRDLDLEMNERTMRSVRGGHDPRSRKSDRRRRRLRSQRFGPIICFPGPGRGFRRRNRFT